MNVEFRSCGLPDGGIPINTTTIIMYSRLDFSARQLLQRHRNFPAEEGNLFQRGAFIFFPCSCLILMHLHKYISPSQRFSPSFYSRQRKTPVPVSLPEPPSSLPLLLTVSFPFLTELQSSEEDSQDESPVESVPIRGKKASLVPLHSHCPYVVVCFLPTALNNGLFCATAEAG